MEYGQYSRTYGFTLIELLVAIAISAGVTLMVYQAMTGALNIEERVRTVNQATNDLSRVWQLLADDLQHAVARPWSDEFNNAQPPMTGELGESLSQSDITIGADNHILLFVRGGEQNFFKQPRSNLFMAGYRITANDKDETSGEKSDTVSLWRDQWRPIDAVGDVKVKSRRLLDNINSIRFRYLPRSVDSVTDEAWINGWPESQGAISSSTDTSATGQLPAAVEVTIELEGFGEVMRLFAVAEEQLQ